MATEIAITDREAAFMANGIYRAITHDMKDIISEYALPTSIGAGLFRYNYIYKNLTSEFGGRFDWSFHRIGFWTLLILHDKVSNLTFSVMSENTLKRLLQHQSEKPRHIEALVSKNKMREPASRQLALFDIEYEKDADELESLRQKLLLGFDGVIGEHVLIVFDSNYAGAISCRAVLLTPDLEIGYSEDWSKHLKEYVVPEATVLASLLEPDEDLPLATLKSELFEDLEESFLVSQARDEKIDD